MFEETGECFFTSCTKVFQQSQSKAVGVVCSLRLSSIIHHKKNDQLCREEVQISNIKAENVIRVIKDTHPIHGNNCSLPVFALKSLRVKLREEIINRQCALKQHFNAAVKC